MSDVSFPRQQARTRGFSLGVPRAFVLSPEGDRVLFLRARAGNDPETCLYSYDVASRKETLLVDPSSLSRSAHDVELPAAERARRERARESSAGIVRFSADDTATHAVFDLGGRVFTIDVANGEVAELPVRTPAVDARIDPTGRHVAYVESGSLRLVPTPFGSGSGGDRAVLTPEGPNVTYGLAEFVAAEEMDRDAGYWWSPDGTKLLAERADVSNVARRYIADPARPEVPPVEVAYPHAGSDNADVRLLIVSLGGETTSVEWDRTSYEYLVSATWSSHGLLVVVQNRQQTRLRILEVDPANGATSVLLDDSDTAWVDIVRGVPRRLEDGSLVWTVDSDGAKRLVIGGQEVTPTTLQVREVLGIDGGTVIFRGSPRPTANSVFTWSREAGVEAVGPPGGVELATRSGGTTVLTRADLGTPGRTVSVLRGEEVGRIESLAETPVVAPEVNLREYGDDGLHTAVLFPSGHVIGSGKLPVLLAPYGGPHHQMVVEASGSFLEAQWFADQGFAVVVADGHGTPARGPEWDRSIRGEIAGPVLADQVEALHGAAAEFADLDLAKVAIRGWSFGGYLAALAVLRRPDVFHAAVAGAPVTEWRLYDTHYTERYLGHPGKEPENYARTSLLEDAANLQRPLLIIHGMVDDNVAVANTLLLSSALLAAGRQHAVLPLSGVTHMTPQEVVAENLLLLQLDFLRTALAVA